MAIKVKINSYLFSLLLLIPNYGKSQENEARYILYNSLVGGITGGLGSIINRNQNEGFGKTFIRGFVTGTGGGLIVYSGKKMSWLVTEKKELGWAWVSRLVFSAGNSIVENAAANRKFYSRWHYDVAFIRFEFESGSKKISPQLMPSAFLGFILTAIKSEPDYKNSLASGTVLFRRSKTIFAPGLTAITSGNSILINDSLSNSYFHEVFAHEMVHLYQFQEFAGFNYFFTPVKDQWNKGYPGFRKLDKWIYGDLNFEAMLFNYFILNKGAKPFSYCNNFLEQEAEFLSNRRPACIK